MDFRPLSMPRGGELHVPCLMISLPQLRFVVHIIKVLSTSCFKRLGWSDVLERKLLSQYTAQQSKGMKYSLVSVWVLYARISEHFFVTWLSLHCTLEGIPRQLVLILGKCSNGLARVIHRLLSTRHPDGAIM